MFRIIIPDKCCIVGQNILLPKNIDDRIIDIDGSYWVLEEFSTPGGNSIFFGLRNYDNYDPISNFGMVMKLCKFPLSIKGKKGFKPVTKFEKAHNRFQNEISILERCKNENLVGVIELIDHGTIIINHQWRGTSKKRIYASILMEFANGNLTSEIEKKDLNTVDKIEFITSLINSFIDFHNLGYYHRDIKSHNMLMCGDSLKIGDLGLAIDRDEENTLDALNEKIWPRGWASPESVNKFLTEGKPYGSGFDSNIDDYSDIFQLGKLFWFIFNRNLPIGIVQLDDFITGEEDVFKLIHQMLSYNKSNRPKLTTLKDEFEVLYAKYGGFNGYQANQ